MLGKISQRYVCCRTLQIFVNIKTNHNMSEKMKREALTFFFFPIWIPITKKKNRGELKSFYFDFW